MKFNNIRLLVNNFDECFAFYNDLLGLKCTWGKPGDNFASFDIGLPSGLGLFRKELMAAALDIPDNDRKEKCAESFVIVVQVDSVDETYARLKKKGVAFITGPRDMADWGIRVAHFRDPENNLIELFSDLSQDQ